MHQRSRRILQVFGKDTVADQDARPGRREHHVPAIKVDIAVCNRQTELRSKILTKIGPQIRIVFQIGRLIAEGHQLSGACPHRHEVPQPDVFGVREKTVGDVVGVKRGGEVGAKGVLT